MIQKLREVQGDWVQCGIREANDVSVAVQGPRFSESSKGERSDDIRPLKEFRVIADLL